MSRKPVTQVVRSAGAFVCGYVALAAANMAFVLLWFADPAVPPPPTVIAVGAAVWVGATGVAAGRLVAAVAGRSGRGHATAASLAAALVVLASMVWDVSLEPDWYKLWYAAIVVPVTMAGGSWGDHIRLRRALRPPARSADPPGNH